MIIPLHLFPDQRAPQFTFDSPIVGPVDGADVQRFHALMYRQGMELEPTRMVYDRHYAFERLAAGFGSSNESLRDLAVQMFAEYQQAGEFIGLAH
jgi:hypothetical protein